MTIKIFVTGGTFDKEYNELKGELYFKRSHVREMLRLGRCRTHFDIKTLMMIDSLFMTYSDRKRILANCKKAKEKRMIITHGTDTMEVTARFLGPRIKNKTVVLTGAMIPYKFGSSDGFFNLGNALAYAQCNSPGVYIVMNGKCFKWNNVTKNRATGIFEERKA